MHMRALEWLWRLLIACGLIGVLTTQIIQCRRENMVYFALLDAARTEAILNQALANNTLDILDKGQIPSASFETVLVEKLLCDRHLPNGLRGLLEFYLVEVRSRNTQLEMLRRRSVSSAVRADDLRDTRQHILSGREKIDQGLADLDKEMDTLQLGKHVLPPQR